MKEDFQYLQEGRISIGKMLHDAMSRGVAASETAQNISGQFIELTDLGDPEIDQWTIRVLIELSKEPDPLGGKVPLVPQAMCLHGRQRLSVGGRVQDGIAADRDQRAGALRL